ncbi:MAG: hypothetical protein GNW80_06875 [Asgard group archaeon]|nr:hypothetical protein [Asgard group archaeon]
MGPGLMGIYFLEPDALSEIFAELSNETYVSTQFSDSEYTFNQIGGQFDNTTTIAVFDWVLDMDYVNATESTNFGGLSDSKLLLIPIRDKLKAIILTWITAEL